MNFKKILIIAFYFATFILLAFSNYSLLYVIPIYIVYTMLLFIVFKNEFDAFIANYNYALGNGDKAEKFFMSAIKKNTQNPIAYLNYSIMLSHRGEALKSIDLLNKAETLKPNILTSKNILLTKATCYWVSGDIETGINLLLQLINKYDYANTNVLTTLGFFYIINNDYKNAIKYTNLALEEDPNYFLAYDNLGQIEYRLGAYDKALQYFNKVIENYN